MNPSEIRTLRLLEAIESDPGPSQRDLARQLNVSLGLVNSFVRRLARKGYFKITTVPKNRVRYILTPKGALEKTRLTYAYLHYSYTFYRDARRKLRGLFAALSGRKIRRIAFYGVGDLAEMAYICLQEFPLQLEAVVSDRQAAEPFLGLKVQAPAEVDWSRIDTVVMTDQAPAADAIAGLTGLGISRERIATF